MRDIALVFFMTWLLMSCRQDAVQETPAFEGSAPDVSDNSPINPASENEKPARPPTTAAQNPEPPVLETSTSRQR
jgi:hypothetical protein